MSKYAGEEVLVVPREVFESCGHFEGFCGDVEAYLEHLLDPANNFFMDRAAAEEDPSHKQLIPYAIFKCGDRILHYTRGKSGGESRLHAKISIGVGGHINPVDAGEQHLGEQTYLAAVERELDEELNIGCGFTQRVVGLINDDVNPVGQVHLGVVHLFELESEAVEANEDALANLSFMDLKSLRGELHPRLETWSQFCVDWLAGLA